jgi:hypothetical protein
MLVSLISDIATVTAVEVWGMTASILTVLTLMLGGVWKVGRLTLRQIAATRDNTTAISQLTRRLTKVEAGVIAVPGAVAEKMENGGD